MTEGQWLNTSDPHLMVRFLKKASGRKLRLFACACVRRMGALLLDDRSREALEVAERYAEGMARQNDLKAAEANAWAAVGCVEGRHGHEPWGTAGRRAVRVARQAAAVVHRMAWKAASDVADESQGGQCDLLREMFGPLPFRPVIIPSSVRTWNEGTIPKLAEAAYQERSLPSGEFDRHRLAVLADALEEVGADPLLLDHLRGPGPHVRGDWVVDMLTGREASP